MTTRLSLKHADRPMVQAGAQNGAKLAAIATTGGMTFLHNRARISGGTIAAPYQTELSEAFSQLD